MIGVPATNCWTSCAFHLFSSNANGRFEDTCEFSICSLDKSSGEVTNCNASEAVSITKDNTLLEVLHTTKETYS